MKDKIIDFILIIVCFLALCLAMHSIFKPVKDDGVKTQPINDQQVFQEKFDKAWQDRFDKEQRAKQLKEWNEFIKQTEKRK